MIQSIRGTKDIFGDQMNGWYFVEEQFRKVADEFGYKEIRTPIFEKTEVFHRTIGDGTDIVNKEMYTFVDKGGESVTLRPEMTAALVRAIVQNNMMAQLSISRLWYFGPFFRYERPQKGRLRQFHQFGAECLGSPYPESDAEVILLADRLFRSLGIDNYKLNINSLGNQFSRISYKDALVDFLNSNKTELSEESRQRIEKNPLRVLDSKADNDIEILKSAPSILDYLDDSSKEHFEKVKNMLDSAGLAYELNSNLVRGLDYYCHTVFEFQSSLLGSQDAFGGGGRYDGLVEQLGGNPTPGVGFALGVERLLIILESLKSPVPDYGQSDYQVITMSDNEIAYGMKIANELRKIGFNVIMDLNRRSFKAQMRDANKNGVSFAAIIGESEKLNRQVAIKDMKSGEQQLINMDDLHKLRKK